MIHYIYKIVFLRGYPTGRYYLGKRSYRGTDIRKDKYTGSGSFPEAYFKAYGKKEGYTYLKEIIEINPSSKINADRETAIIGDKWKTDPLCMNVCRGGGGGDLCAAKSIIQYDFDGNIINTFRSECEAAESIGAACSSSISRACINKISIAHGYIWRFLEDPLTKKELHEFNNKYVPVNQYTQNGVFIKQWPSIKDAGNTLGIDCVSIAMVCSGRSKNRHTAGGYVWTRFNKPFINNKKVLSYSWKRKVLQYDTYGNFINKYDSLASAGKANHINWQNIQSCCKKETAVAGNYIWRFDGDTLSKKDIKIAQQSLKEYDYIQLDKFGKFIAKYNSLLKASKAVNVNYQNIQAAVKRNITAGGFYWKKVEHVAEN